jgi:hypothetical protein
MPMDKEQIRGRVDGGAGVGDEQSSTGVSMPS